MSYWLESAPHSANDAAAATATALAAELRAEAARFDMLRDLLERAHRALPDAVSCEGWMGRSRSAFDARVETLAGAVLAGSHHAAAAADACTNQARDAEDRAALAAAGGWLP